MLSRRAQHRISVASLSKTGQAPLKVLFQLIVATMVLMIAIVVFITLWNGFIGSSASRDDAKDLATLIEFMVDQDEKYMQQPFILRLEDNIIVGFDLEDNDPVLIRSQHTQQQATPIIIEEPASCEDEVCICNADNAGVIQKCYDVTPKKEASVILASDYSYFLSGVEVEDDVPAGASRTGMYGSYSKFAINRQTVEYMRTNPTSNGRTEAGAKAIIPVIIEKQASEEQVLITIIPDTHYGRSRMFSMFTCPCTNDECNGVCDGKTPLESASTAGLQYCEVNILDNTCDVRSLVACDNTKPIEMPCLCGGQVVSWGVCGTVAANQEHYKILCEGITQCLDYCRRDGGLPPGTNEATADSYDLNFCELTEFPICMHNPCNLNTECATAPSRDGWRLCDSTSQ